MIEADLAALARRYAAPAPRYTSYPTATEFTERFDADDYARELRAASTVDDPWALYVHLPFCHERCAFCACSAIGSPRGDEVAAPYVERLEAELRLVSRHIGSRRRVASLHWGGGTPTYLSASLIQRLAGTLRTTFDLAPDAELGVEVDPRVTTAAHMQALAGAGFNRISIGVQDFDPEVQRHIGRNQTAAATRHVIAQARDLGMGAVNLDLVYGLPGQTSDSLAATLDRVLELRPSRIALYGYAHVPHLRSNQRSIDTSALPDPEARLSLWLQARAILETGGYVTIGMDHFALEHDELARASRSGTLGRNFMGYTVSAAADVLGLGLTAIGNVGPAYTQNFKKLARYYRALDDGVLPVERGLVRSPDDSVRGKIIMDVMCCRPIRRTDVELADGAEFEDAFSTELEALTPMLEDGLVTDDGTTLCVTERGRPFVRSIAAVFDTHRRATARPAAAAV